MGRREQEHGAARVRADSRRAAAAAAATGWRVQQQQQRQLVASHADAIAISNAAALSWPPNARPHSHTTAQHAPLSPLTHPLNPLTVLAAARFLSRPYGRVDRPKLKRTLLERCVAAGG